MPDVVGATYILCIVCNGLYEGTWLFNTTAGGSFEDTCDRRNWNEYYAMV